MIFKVKKHTHTLVEKKKKILILKLTKINNNNNNTKQLKNGFNVRTWLQRITKNSGAISESTDAAGTHWKAFSFEADVALQKERNG